MRRSHWLGVILLLTICGGLSVWHLFATDPVVGFATVGRDPWPLVVDEATSRAFVYNRTDGSVSTIDTGSGALVGTVPAGSSFAFMAVDQRTGRLFVSSGGDDTIYTLDARSGAVLHQVTDTAATVRGLVVDEQRDHVFVGHRDSPTLTLLDARSGTILRHIPVCMGSFAVALSVRFGHVFAKCNEGITDMLDARTGRVLAAAPTNSQFGCVVVDEPTNRVFEANTSAAVVDVLDARTGAHLRTLPQLDAVSCGAIDARTGDFYLPLSGPGIPFVGSAPTNQVVVLDGHTGTILRRITVAENPISVAVDSRTHRLLVGSIGTVDRSGQPRDYGVLSVLDTTAGTLVRRVTVGINPADMAIDRRTQHVLIANETVDTTGLVTGVANPLTTSPPEAPWARIRRQWLEDLHRVLPWLPMPLPRPPSPPTKGTVTTLDLGRF